MQGKRERKENGNLGKKRAGKKCKKWKTEGSDIMQEMVKSIELNKEKD